MLAYKPPQVTITSSGRTFGVAGITGQVLEAHQYAGGTIGSAVIVFPAHYAIDGQPDMGESVRLSMGGRTIFRGVVGHGPYVISTSEDELQLVLFDDKWRLESETIGRYGVGTQDEDGALGFRDVGFEVVFNAGGIPNKDPEGLDFCTGSGAAYWTLYDIIAFTFSYYCPADIEIALGELSDAWLRIPTSVNAVGQTVLQLLTDLAEMAGESWTLRPGGNGSTYVPIRNGDGRVRTIRMFRPKAKGQADAITEECPTDLSIALSIEGAFDVFQVMSGPIVKETTYSTEGEDPLLVRVEDFADPEYFARWAVDVTAYEAHGLGQNLSPGSPAKPWLQHLVTRRADAGDAYLTATELATEPEKKAAEQVERPQLWICYETSEDLTKLHFVSGNVRFDTNRGTVDLKATIECADDNSENPFPVNIEALDPGRIRLYLTVATQLELGQTVVSDTGRRYLPEPRIQTIRKLDVVPERRQAARLPDLAGDPNDTVVVAESAEELYVDVTTELEEALASAEDFNPELQRPITASFAFVPDIEVGDRLVIAGRATGATGKELVTEVSFKFADDVIDVTTIKATNVPAAVDPQRFVEPE